MLRGRKERNAPTRNDQRYSTLERLSKLNIYTGCTAPTLIPGQSAWSNNGVAHFHLRDFQPGSQSKQTSWAHRADMKRSRTAARCRNTEQSRVAGRTMKLLGTSRIQLNRLPQTSRAMFSFWKGECQSVMKARVKRNNLSNPIPIINMAPKY